MDTLDVLDWIWPAWIGGLVHHIPDLMTGLVLLPCVLHHQGVIWYEQFMQQCWASYSCQIKSGICINIWSHGRKQMKWRNFSWQALQKLLVDKEAKACMLGALTEQEISDMFNAIKTSKHDEPTIWWHELLATWFSQAMADYCSLHLVLDWLDTDQ